MNIDHSPFLMSFRKILILLGGVGLLLVAGLLFVPNAATAIWEFRWFPLHLGGGILLSAGLCSRLFAKPRTLSRSTIFPGACLGLMALGFIAGALHGPFPARALIYSFSPLAALFCGVVLLVSVGKEDLRKLFASSGFQCLIAGFVLLWCGLSLMSFLSKEVFPLFAFARRLDAAAQGGLYDLILNQRLPDLRNAGPFGHANYNSGFLLLLLPLLYHGIRQPAGKGLRILSLTALGVGLLMLVSTQSRNALLGLAAGVGIYVWWTRSSIKRLLPVVGAGLLVLGLLIILLPRFQSGLLQVSPGRWGMWTAAWWTGLSYFPWGCGEGLTPEMIQLTAPALASVWENSIQFHHTWLHLWAVGGLAAAGGLLLITLWAGLLVLRPWKCDVTDKKELIPSVVALSATFVLFWADYQFEVFPMALLFVFHLTVLAVGTSPSATPSPAKPVLPQWLIAVPALALLISVCMLPASYRSRQAIDRAGIAFETGDYPESLSRYLEAYAAVTEPYALNMAAMISSNQDPDKAIDLFNASLDLWEPQVLVHEYLTELYRNAAKKQNGPEKRQALLSKALKHAVRRANIAPQLTGSYLDVAAIASQMKLPEPVVIDALFYELLMQGDLLFPATWPVLGELGGYETAVLRKLMTFDTDKHPRMRARVEFLQGILNAAGRIPPGTRLSDAARIRFEDALTRPGGLQLLEALNQAQPQMQGQAMRRLLVYLLKTEVADDTVHALLHPIADDQADAMETMFSFGEARILPSTFQGVGLSARHPYAIPVMRSRSYPDVFGARFIPEIQHKPFSVDFPHQKKF